MQPFIGDSDISILMNEIFSTDRRKPRPKCTILSQFWRELCRIRYRGLIWDDVSSGSLNKKLK